MALECSDAALEVLGLQALQGGAYQTPDAVAQSINAVTADDVINVSPLVSSHLRIFSHHTKVHMEI